MYRLKKWSLETSTNGFRGHGNCYDNPRFFSGDFITTSHIVRIDVENEERRLKLFTESRSCYILEYADINDSKIESTQKVLKGMDVVVDLQICVALRAERIEATKKKLADQGLCDWRIFLSLFLAKKYHWSDDLEAVHIENVGENFMFEGSKNKILCKSGAVTLIKIEKYVEEYS